ncbi:MAG TPA: YdcF family protein [Gemmatimonadales bacterium]|nr:YdcF family protein [Gemmatimonadales bacterium]
MRWAKHLLGFGLLAAAVAYGVAFASVLAVSRQDEARRAPAIVVLGAAQYNGKPSPVLKARLDHAAALYADSIAPLIVLTGGTAEGDKASEAEVAASYLERTVPPPALVVLPTGRTTDESIVAAAEWCRGYGITEVVVVSDPFHMLRVRLEARRQGLTAYTSPTRTSPISAHFTRELSYLMAEALKVLISGGRG